MAENVGPENGEKQETEFPKTQFLSYYVAKQRELGKRQREYKRLLGVKLKTRRETIIESSYQATIARLNDEKKDLRAQIWVASGSTHQRENQRHLAEISCHVSCQERLFDNIQTLKSDITHLEKEMSRVNKQIYDLNRKTVPDSQHLEYVAHARKKLNILENQLEVGIKRECGFTALNAQLREELVRILNHRTFFNETYTKLVQKLNSDKKYLIDLIEYALATFENCIDVYEKIDILSKKDAKERELRKTELQSFMRKQAADTDNAEFIDCKGKKRRMAPLQDKEFRRRAEFRRKHTRKIAIYNDILDKILEYTQSHNVESVIEKFQQQESLYYSYFNYANEMSYHITLLNNSVNRLYTNITFLKTENRNTFDNQMDTIASLEQLLRERQESNEALQTLRENNDNRLDTLLQGFEAILEESNCDISPLMLLLGNHSNVNLVNVNRFLKILEKRLFDIIASVFIMERKTDEKPFGDFVVKQVEKFYENPTNLDDIVLTQQCPECAEGEAFNMDDAGEGIIVLTKEDAKKKLYEKINQPEMQYRLHSISQCRLPHSRILAAKRNI